MAKARARRRNSKPVADLALSPSQRLREHGAGSLSDAEVLAVACGLELAVAKGLLEASEGVGGLRRRLRSPTALAGWQPEAEDRLRAVLELAVRMAKARIVRVPLLNRQSAAVAYLQLRYPQPGQEVAGALLLDSRGRLIGDRELFRGSRDRCAISPEPFLREALLLGASAVIAWHTHPSGAPQPSTADVAFTGRLAEACDVVGVRLVDHLVLGEKGKWESALGSRG